MKLAKTRTAALLGLLAGLSLAFSANAASTWTFTGSGATVANEPQANLTYAGTNLTSGQASDASLTISGAYAANGATTTGTGGNNGINTGFASATTTWSTATPGSNPLFFSGSPTDFGVGMCSDPATAGTACGVPNHAMDNVGNTESLLLSFGNSVSLTSIGIGYVNTDADISIFRYTGTTAPTLNGKGANLNAMATAGWELVGNYGDLVVDTSNPYNIVNSGNKGSSWWLISAYNSSYGAATSGTVNEGNDYFKVYAVAASKCTTVNSSGVCNGSNIKVPEPGSLALASLALFGVIYTRRQSQQKKG